MKKNMGNIDRIIRFSVVAFILGLYFAEILSGTLGIISLVFAAIVLFTIVSGRCPLYLPFGIKTCSTKIKGKRVLR